MTTIKRYHILMVLCIAAAGSGCVVERVVHDSWGPLRELADPVTPQSGSGRPGNPMPASGWAIMLGEFRGRDRNRDAQALAKRVTQKGFVPDVWVRDEGDRTRVYRGRFADPDNWTAQDALRQTRLVSLGNSRPFESARLVSLNEAPGAVAADPLDLKQYMGLYSLQIAVYDDTFGPDFRDAAEKAARVLRDDGVEAYYYHGPHRSMVTVGVFTYEMAFHSRVGRQDVYSELIRALQRKFPNNLYNGLTIIEKRPGQDDLTQPSFLVRII